MTAVYKRELRSYFTSMVGYVFIAILIFFVGIYFMAYNLFGGYPSFGYVLLSCTIIFMVAVPILTMRSMAEDRRGKTDQLLLTSPVSLTGIVLGKYLAMVTVLLVPILLICFCPLIIAMNGSATLTADYAAILQVLTDAGVDTTDVLSALTAHSSENIYYRTDHHWTSLGAYYAYCAWRDIEPAAGEWTQEILCGNFRGTTWNKVPLPTVPAEEITAWYKHEYHNVSYNGGEYETNSIYECKYLSGSDQHAVFLNSNQAQTVISGSGKSGKLLLIKDSYGNTFSQFPVEDYAEVHVLDLRFFKGDVAEYAKENGITDTLVLYGTQNFVKDTNIKF